MNRNSIIEFLESNKSFIHKEYGVKKIGVFGSFIKGQTDQNSDVDIAIEMEENKKNIHNFLALKRYLEENLNREVDLGIESTLKPAIRNKIKDHIIYV